MTTLCEESTGHLSIAIVESKDHGIEDIVFRSAADAVAIGESVIVVDAAGCFEPKRMTHSARVGGIDPVGILRHLQIHRVRSAPELEQTILKLKDSLDRIGPRTVLIPDLLGKLYDPSIPTRDAARILGRVKTALEEMSKKGTNIVVICSSRETELGTRAHFLSSLCNAADRVHFRSNT